MPRTSTFKSPFADFETKKENGMKTIPNVFANFKAKKTSPEDKLLQELGIDPTVRLRAQLHKGKIQIKPDFSDDFEVTFYSYYDEVELEEGWYDVELGEKIDSERKLGHRRIFEQRVLNPTRTKF